jgi:hypothetical protein
MRPRINPLVFLARLLVFFALTYLCWQPIAPSYAQFLLRAARVGVWLSEFSTDPLWQHPTELLIVPARSPTAIFYLHQTLFAQYQIPPQGIPAEWVMANLVLLIPLMLATPAPTWRARFLKLGLAVLVALVLQVIDVVVGIKAFYSSTFRDTWSPFATKLYQFLDAFFQSWDTQLFPFAIWAGINFRQLLPERLFAPPPSRAAATPAAKPTESRAERRRRQRRS